MPPELIDWYPLLMAAWAWSYSYPFKDLLYLRSGAVSAAGWMAHYGLEVYPQLRKVVVGLDQIALGMIFFLIAMTISLKKAGIWPRSISRWLAWLVGVPMLESWKPASPRATGRQEAAEA